MKKLLLLTVLLGALPLFGQGTSFPVFNRQGWTMAGAVVTTCTGTADPGTNPLPCSARATTFTDQTLTTQCASINVVTGPTVGPTRGAGCTNPGTTDSHGNATIFAADGFYWAQVSGYQVVPQTFPFDIGAGGGSGALPCGTTNDIQNYLSAILFGCDTGIGILDPVQHLISENKLNANQEVDVSDSTHTGLLDMGHSNGSTIDAHFKLSLGASFSTTNGGYGINVPNSPAINKPLCITSLTPDANGLLPSDWCASASANVSAENRAYLFTNTPCNSPGTCPDIPFTPVVWGPNLVFLGPQTNTNHLGSLSNTANWNASIAQTTHSVTLPTVTVTGDPLVVIFSSGTSVSGIADTCGNTFTHLTPSGWHIWYAAHSVACTTLDVITVTLTGSDGAMMLAGEVINGGDLDTSSSGSSCSGGGPYTVTATALTTSTADILIGLLKTGGTGSGSYEQFYPSTTFTFANQLAAYVGGLGTNRSMAMGWQPASVVGSNQFIVTGNPYPTGSWICPDAYTMAFKPASAGGADYPTPRNIRLKDLQASSDFGGLADQNFWWYSGNSQAFLAGSFGSGLSFNTTTGVLTASGTGVASIQPQNNGVNYGSALTGAVTMNFANCTVSSTFTITCPTASIATDSTQGTIETKTCTNQFFRAIVSGTGIPTCASIATADLPNTAVTPASYTNTNLTVDATGRITAAANGSAGSSTIYSGTTVLGTSAIASGACATVVTTSATGVLTTDTLKCGFNTDPTGLTGYGVSASSAVLTIYPYPTANNVNVKVCNSSSGSITPSALTLNCQVVR